MSAQENVETVKKFFAALRGGDTQGLLAVSAEDIEWIVPGKGWPLAGTHRGHAGLTDLLQKASETVETSYPTPFEFVAQGDRVWLPIGAIPKTPRKHPRKSRRMDVVSLRSKLI